MHGNAMSVQETPTGLDIESFHEIDSSHVQQERRVQRCGLVCDECCVSSVYGLAVGASPFDTLPCSTAGAA